MKERAILEILDQAAEQWFRGDHLKRELLLEVSRLNLLEQHYHNKALSDGEGAMTAAALVEKVSERKSTLIGLNAPAQTASITISQSATATRVTSTERIRQVLDELRLPQPNGEADSGEP